MIKKCTLVNDGVWRFESFALELRRIVREFIVQQQIQTMEWPAGSPHLNPIDHLWDQLGRAVRRRINRHNTLLDLRRYPQEECNPLPQERIRGLINTMRQRCQACLKQA